MDRLALTPADLDARVWLIEQARAHGLHCGADALGNVFVTLGGRPDAVAPVMTGSHLDTQPNGGKYDGVFGVLAGLEAILALAGDGVRLLRPVTLVAWTNEEGARFQPGAMGSRGFAAPGTLAAYLDSRDANGVSVADSLRLWEARCGPIDKLPLGFPVASYVEAHIEQGPVLEQRGATIGVVTGIQGIRRYVVRVRGFAAHAGTTPRAIRRDALREALCLAQRLYLECEDAEDVLRFTIGRFVVSPGGVSVVPDGVEFSIDLRHPDGAMLADAGARIERVCLQHEGVCEVELTETSRSEPIAFDQRVVRQVAAASESCGCSYTSMPSGAGHDAQNLARLCPTGMIFIPCAGGISHNPAERVDIEHMHAGAAVLLETLKALGAAPSTER